MFKNNDIIAKIKSRTDCPLSLALDLFANEFLFKYTLSKLVREGVGGCLVQ